MKKESTVKSEGKYREAIGRRKTAVARVRLFEENPGIIINEKKLEDYFTLPRLRMVIESPLVRLNLSDKLGISVKVKGGGPTAQAEAVRHGISRALALLMPETRIQLHSLGFLTRDPRMVERKKYGLKKARRAPQWAKR